MARAEPRYSCQECGQVALTWSGRCPGCREWNTLVEAPPARTASKRSPGAAARAAATARLQTGIGELNRVLGSGLVLGSLVLLGGSPGIGKSTLTGMALGNLSAAGRTTLYVSGEESAAQ